MKQVLILITVLISSLPAFANTEAQIERAKKLAVTCAACHGEKGVSQNPLWPNLAGQKKDYLLKQLQDFKAGRRVDPLMAPMAGTLSDRDMEDLAVYFSSLQPSWPLARASRARLNGAYR